MERRVDEYWVLVCPLGNGEWQSPDLIHGVASAEGGAQDCGCRWGTVTPAEAQKGLAEPHPHWDLKGGKRQRTEGAWAGARAQPG